MFRQILCPIDFSPASQQAMRAATRLAAPSEAALVLAHPWQLPTYVAAGEYLIPPETIQVLVDDATKMLADAAREAVALGAKHVTTSLLSGAPWTAIVDAAGGDPPADLIVMGTHGRSGVGRFLLGSVAEQVVRHAPCDVAVIRGDGMEAPIRHVLCPIDFSDSSRAAAERAVELVTPGGAGIELLHVIEVPTGYSGRAAIAAPMTVDQTAGRLLDRWADELRAKNVAITTQVLTGHAATAILSRLSATPSFDLVVMGSHGRTGIRRALLGSVAERTVRHAPCPVLVARGTTVSAAN